MDSSAIREGGKVRGRRRGGGGGRIQVEGPAISLEVERVAFVTGSSTGQDGVVG